MKAEIKQSVRSAGKSALALSLIAAGMHASDLIAQDGMVLEEISVTGSYIKRTPGDTALPVQVLDNEFIRGIGATTVEDVVAKLSINSGAENQADSFTQGATQGTGNVNLRGLGLSSTLVLINGRRQTISGALSNDGSVFVDISTIPVDALERVEILKEGAASTYGSDAIAGVANFILRKDFDGFEISGGYQQVQDGGQKDKDVGFVWGSSNGQTSFLLSGHYLDRTPLSASERPELIDNAISSLGATFLPFSAVTVDSGPYAGSYGAFENVPLPGCEESDGGVLVPQAFGTRCGFHYGPRYNLVNKETRAQLYGNITHDFDNGMQFLAELGVASNEVKDNPQSPSFPDLSFPIIGADHPSNPFGTAVVWLGRPLAAGFESPLAPRTNDTIRMSFNLSGAFENGWDWDTALTYSQNEYTHFQQDTLSSRLQAGLIGQGGPNNDEYFDPFVPENNSAGLIEDFSYVIEGKRTTDLLVFDAITSGEAFDTAAGPIGFAAGIQVRDEGFQVETDDVNEIRFDEDGNPIPIDLIFWGGLSEVDVDRSTFAAFVETQIPVTDNLELTGAVRYERLENDTSVDPKLALRWQLTDQLILRASASTAFREPSMAQQHASSATLNGIQDFNEDGTPRGGVAFIRVAATGSDTLKPEESENLNLGVVFQPNEDLDFKLDYWRVDYTDLITVESPQGKIIDDINGPDIVRDAFGNLAGINVDFFNSSQVVVDGLDFESTWFINDSWFTSLNVAHLLGYELTLPSGELVEAAGFFNNNNFARSLPETKSNLNLSWTGEGQRATVNLNYTSGYDQNLDVPDTESSSIDSFVTVDAQYSFDFIPGGNDSLAEISLGVKNLFDEEPPRVFDGANLSYDPKQHSPLGRVFYAKATYSF